MPYRIIDGYVHRDSVRHFDDTVFRDEWQDEVYGVARSLLRHGSTVLDIGCGGAFKLLKYFQHHHTCGAEIDPTLSWLRQTHPERQWTESARRYEHFDMVICSDVIEHVRDPEELLGSILTATPEVVILSTPDRSLLNSDPMGPPRNECHYREWTFGEFEEFVGQFFLIDTHFISNHQQATQVIVCRPQRS